MTLTAPFPWFGGKRRVAEVVWRAFGENVPNYVEPFLGSGAVLLARPGGAGKIETGNDLDCYVSNFFRAVTYAPDETAKWCDWPVNEADMHARHEWLLAQTEFRDLMHSDPWYFDPLIAGWWVWGICQWIGGGWCDVKAGRNMKAPKLDGIGKGVHSKRAARQRPHLTGNSRMVLAPQGRPDMSSPGKGVHLPNLGNHRGYQGISAPPALEWFRALSDRLRPVRLACGDWKRVLSPSVLGKGEGVGGRRPTAVFLDPPYDPALRNKKIYACDSATLSSDVREWCLEHGDDPDLRIALCGYAEEHKMPASWRVYDWTAARGYASKQNENRTQERIWFSPHCLDVERQLPLFQEAT